VRGIDCGVAVQPDNIVAQTESSIVYGLGMSLSEVSRQGRHRLAVQLLRLRVPRMNEVPEMHIEVIAMDNHPTGARQMTMALIAPAISSAVMQLTGVRLRHTPFTPDRVQKALA
jgi:isoquinoline 1-oxidoreductase beta subunit